MLNLLLDRRNRRRFTLLELVVVIAILATLAGLVIPQISMLGRSSDMAATAKNTSDVGNNLGLFFVLQKRYPQGMDSLLVNGTTLHLPSNGTATAAAGPGGAANGVNEANQTAGLPISGPSMYRYLEIAAIGSDLARSFTRCGFDFVFDHDANPALDDNVAATIRRPATGNFSGTGPHNVAVLDKDAAWNADGSAAGTLNSPIMRQLFPATNGTIPSGTDPAAEVVVLGFGGSASALGKTVLNTPIFPGCDGRYYGRYLAYFLVYPTGERATLIGVSDSYGRLSDYAIQQYNQSLPDGARQN